MQKIKNKKSMMFLYILFVLIAFFQCNSIDDQPANIPIMTKWAADLTPQNVLQEYPRPQMVRNDWQNLNGSWEYAILPRKSTHPSDYQGKILVPFPIESALSGVGKNVGTENTLWYRRTFHIPTKWQNKQILLNFGAVDWETIVWVNGEKIGSHKGGYDAFTFDITEELKNKKEHELIIAVWDPTSDSYQPRGKQVKNPRGIWYTAVTGIWQTVWLEPVSNSHINSVKITPDIDNDRVCILTNCENADGYKVQLSIIDNGKLVEKVSGISGQDLDITIKNPKLWWPDDPFLYDLKIQLKGKKGQKLDEISSYFGMRKNSLGKDKNGITKLFLNNKEIFQYGPLDQGWWPDGLYTAPSDEALRYDIEVTKKLGFNMARKHVKVEPSRWYYWCDKLGLMVWQDMPSGDKYIDVNDPDLIRSEESSAQFELELKQMISEFYNHPSIVMWVSFNEGWGQFDTERIVDLIKKEDQTRLVDCASGWSDRGVGDVHDIHSYPGPEMPELEENRAAVLGEFGGLGLPVKEHLWKEKDNWGYRGYKNVKELTDAYRILIKNLNFLRKKGLAAAIYTQTTDVETEVNGLMTYDRKMIKMEPDEVNRIYDGYFPPVMETEDEIFLENGTIAISNVGKDGMIRFTTDSSEPTEKSFLYAKPVVFSNTTTVKARLFWPDGSKSGVSELTCEKVGLTEPVKIGGIIPGVRYQYYEDLAQNIEQLPDFSKITPSQRGITKKCDLSVAERDEIFAIKFDGYIKVTETGVYTFYTNSDDGTRLYINNREIVNNDFSHPMQEKDGKIALQAGIYPFTLEFYQGVGGKGLEVYFREPAMDKQEIPADVFYHQE